MKEAKEARTPVRRPAVPGQWREIGTLKWLYFALNVGFCTLNSLICTLPFSARIVEMLWLLAFLRFYTY